MPTFTRGPWIALMMMFFLAAGCSRLIGANFDQHPRADGGGKEADAQTDARDTGDDGDSGDAADAMANDAEDGSKPPKPDAADAPDADEPGQGDAEDASDAEDVGDAQGAADAEDAGDAGDASDGGGCGQCPDNQICCGGTCKRIDATNCFECGAACGATRPVCDLDTRGCVCTATSCPNGQICCGGACKPVDATNCFACGAACESIQPLCALDVQVCACTATSCPIGQACVAGACLGSSVLPLAPHQRWTQYPFYGNEQTSFADVDHDGRADAIAVNDTGITVDQASPNGGFVYKDWITTGPFTGARGTFFADLTGDGCADAIAIGESSIIVRRSNCTNAFGTSEVWGPSDLTAWGSRVGDVNGDGCADLIDIDPDHVKVRLASPCPVPMSAAPFNQPATDWTDIAYVGDVATFVTDATGDGKADAIVLNRNRFSASNGIVVRRSDGTRFLPNEHWSLDTLDTASAALVADVDRKSVV